jgi:hypothetical protein
LITINGAFTFLSKTGSTPLVASLADIAPAAPHIALAPTEVDKVAPLAGNHFVAAFDIPGHTADMAGCMVCWAAMKSAADSIDWMDQADKIVAIVATVDSTG